MKTSISLLFVVLFYQISFSQLTLEGSYQGSNDLKYINLKDAGDKLLIYIHDYTNNIIKVDLYNLDNSIYKQLSFPAENRHVSVLHVSQKIVNNDEKLEIMFHKNDWENNSYKFWIVDEDNVEIFSSENYFINGFTPFDIINQSKQFLFETQNGYRLIIDEYNTQKSQVFSFDSNTTTLSINDINTPSPKLLNAYPNPTKTNIKIPYNAKNNEIVKITIINSEGKVIQLLEADNRFSNIKLDVSSYSSGIYIYKIKNSSGTSFGRFVKE